MSPSGGSNGGLAEAKPAGRSVGARCARGQPPPHKGSGEASPEKDGGDAKGEAPHDAASTRRRGEAPGRICPPLAGSSRWSHGGGGRVMEGEAPSRNEQRERNAARAARLRGYTARGRGMMGCIGDSIVRGRWRWVAANAVASPHKRGGAMTHWRIARRVTSAHVRGDMGGTPWPRLEDWAGAKPRFPRKARAHTLAHTSVTTRGRVITRILYGCFIM